jgi:nicotinate-nucleotide adenylyltransferase
MRSGVFGGTFDPVHIGHLIAAEQVRQDRALDRILFVPSAIPPHKLDEEISGNEDRLAMLRLALAGNHAFELSDIELKRGGVSYTIDTLQELHGKFPDDEWFLLVGADNIREFHTWREPFKIVAIATLLVLTRPGYIPSFDETMPEDRIELCEVPEIGVSSTEIRRRIRDGRRCRYLLPDAVEEYAVRHNLYGR